MPLDLTVPDRAEHTTTTLLEDKYFGIIVPVMVSSNFPMLVPPYFCTTQGRLEWGSGIIAAA